MAAWGMASRRLRLAPLLLFLSPSGPALSDPTPVKVAVLELRSMGVERQTAELLTEVALTEAARFKEFQVIGESDLAALLGLERKKQVLGCQEDAACMAEVGGALGVELVLVGSVGKVGELRRIDLTLLDVAKARVRGRFGESVEGGAERTVAAVQRGVADLLSQARTPEPLVEARAAEGDDGARRERFTVRPGSEILVGSHENWGPNCSPVALPEVKVLRPPRGGSLEVRPGDFAIRGAAVGSTVCAGKVVPGLGVFYRARSPSGSTDSFRYQAVVGYQQKVTRTFEVEIGVE